MPSATVSPPSAEGRDRPSRGREPAGTEAGEMSDPKDTAADPIEMGDGVARLLRLAGARREPPAERAARVRAAVQKEWMRAVRRQGRAPRWIGFGLAAAAAVVLAVRPWRDEMAPLPAP